MKRFVCAVMAAVVLFLTACSSSLDTSRIVYVTETGEKYHRSDCQYLKGGSIEIYLDEATSRGYTACSVCDP